MENVTPNLEIVASIVLRCSNPRGFGLTGLRGFFFAYQGIAGGLSCLAFLPAVLFYTSVCKVSESNYTRNCTRKTGLLRLDQRLRISVNSRSDFDSFFSKSMLVYSFEHVVCRGLHPLHGVVVRNVRGKHPSCVNVAEAVKAIVFDPICL